MLRPGVRDRRDHLYRFGRRCQLDFRSSGEKAEIAVEEPERGRRSAEN